MAARPLLRLLRRRRVRFGLAGLAVWLAAWTVAADTSARASSLSPPVEPRFVATERRSAGEPRERTVVGYCLEPRGAVAVRCRITDGELRCDQGGSRRIECGWRWDDDEEHEPYFRCACSRR